MLSGISSPSGEKHRWHIGTDVFRNKWAMNSLARPCAKVYSPKREKCMSPLSNLCREFSLRCCFSPRQSGVPFIYHFLSNENFLLVSNPRASMTPSTSSQSNLLLHLVTPHADVQVDIWTGAVRAWKSLQLAHFLIEAIGSLSAWHFIATFSAG